MRVGFPICTAQHKLDYAIYQVDYIVVGDWRSHSKLSFVLKMRVAFNHFIPVLQDPISEGNLDRNPAKNYTSITSNGYYGYQPLIINKNNIDNDFNSTNMQTCDGIKFNNFGAFENKLDTERITYEYPHHQSRKRVWDYNVEERERKRKRNNEYPSSMQCNSPSPTKHLHFKPPTHNVPDMPRCIMGHYI
ncbi:hypothetical protein QE152_g10014 [Popillia japonica]|uniref:Uncharacterized protein n=1 Tax=Popillia japonica TaxID=7064 RepID=A0AAW1LVM4_POPJA